MVRLPDAPGETPGATRDLIVHCNAGVPRGEIYAPLPSFVIESARAKTSPCRSRPYRRVSQDGGSLAFLEVRKHGVRGGSQVLQHLPHEEIGFQHLVHLSNQCARSAFTLRNVALARCFAIQLLHLLAEPVDPADLRLDLGLQAGEVNIQALGIERELVIVVNHAVDCSG
jgi:hypothetical protein